ncbi:uncharacterized protein LOC106754636 [Vigna radiata var. radiata]|uniref:Uncharacterized protein LOC106754636 n=1 Tax=Vigna radiata var. radiata TaxID=3916 RepID=A0A3Q0ERP6_VIGRR|nr:uncharacterized protein LOC106754636 [Vigna radiata var. radiata]
MFAKEVEFLELALNNRSVSEYVDRFKHLFRFNTMTVDEDWQCRKFENGLRKEIKLLVKGLRIREFSALVEMARDMEKTKGEPEGPQIQQNQPLRVGGRVVSRVRRTGLQPRQAGRAIERGGTRPQVAGRVYALTGAKAVSAGNLIVSTYLLFGALCVILFDSGATHSFESEACVERLSLVVRELPCNMVVSTPAARLVRTSNVCSRCSIKVEGRRLGYHKILVKADEVQKTAFRSRYGHYGYVVMPFGVTNASAIFMDYIEQDI